MTAMQHAEVEHGEESADASTDSQGWMDVLEAQKKKLIATHK